MKYHYTIIIIFYFLFSSSFSQVNDASQYKFSIDIFNHIQKDSNYWRGGVTSSDLSFIGLYKEALIEWDKARPGKEQIDEQDSLDFIQNFKAIDARSFIIEKAKANQIIIFNEAHYNPRNRVFLTSLLKDLKSIGYKYLAAEAFINTSSFSKVLHPGFHTGFYTMEPQFGNLIREAIKLNFILYPYEDTTGANGKEREIGQAKNIQSLLGGDPRARIIIYCGFNHIREDSVSGWEKAMAGRVKEFTGIDPYTIDQIILSERSREELSNPFFKLINTGVYSIMVDKNGQAFSNNKVDALLYSPPSLYINNRPNWVFENHKVPFFLNSADIEISYPFLLKAYQKSDAVETAIPIDIIEFNSEKELSKTALALPGKGNFLLLLVNNKGSTQRLEVIK